MDAPAHIRQEFRGNEGGKMTKKQKQQATHIWLALSDAYYKINKKIGWDSETQQTLQSIADAIKFCFELSKEA